MIPSGYFPHREKIPRQMQYKHIDRHRKGTFPKLNIQENSELFSNNDSINIKMLQIFSVIVAMKPEVLLKLCCYNIFFKYSRNVSVKDISISPFRLMF